MTIELQVGEVYERTSDGLPTQITRVEIGGHETNILRIGDPADWPVIHAGGLGHRSKDYRPAAEDCVRRLPEYGPVMGEATPPRVCIYLADPPGFGSATPPNPNRVAEQWPEFVAALCRWVAERSGGRHPILVGHSAGALIALDVPQEGDGAPPLRGVLGGAAPVILKPKAGFAARPRVAKTLLSVPPDSLGKRWVRREFAKNFAGDSVAAETVPDRYVEGLGGKRDRVRRFGYMTRYLADRNGGPLSLGNNVPTLLVHAANDVLCENPGSGVDRGRWLRIHTPPREGHALWLEHPELLAEMLHELLELIARAERDSPAIADAPEPPSSGMNGRQAPAASALPRNPSAERTAAGPQRLGRTETDGNADASPAPPAPTPGVSGGYAGDLTAPHLPSTPRWPGDDLHPAGFERGEKTSSPDFTPPPPDAATRGDLGGLLEDEGGMTAHLGGLHCTREVERRIQQEHWLQAEAPWLAALRPAIARVHGGGWSSARIDRHADGSTHLTVERGPSLGEPRRFTVTWRRSADARGEPQLYVDDIS